MDILRIFGLFAISLTTMLLSAKYFTESAEKMGLHFKIPAFIIGVTIMALGTSLPEVATSIIAVIEGHPEIVVGNVVGSNIANILFVLGITAIVGKHLYVNTAMINIDLPILFGSTILMYITTLDGEFSYIDGILSLTILATYLIYNITSKRGVASEEMKDISKKKRQEKEEKFPIKHLGILIISTIFLYFGADFTVSSVVELGAIFHIGTELIAISAVAIGTSLPELIVSVMAALKGKTDLALGNVTGSNIFNALGVMGIPSFFGTLTIPADIIAFTIPAMILITILYIFITMDKEVTKWEGITLLMLYVAFMGKTFGLI